MEGRTRGHGLQKGGKGKDLRQPRGPFKRSVWIHTGHQRKLSSLLPSATSTLCLSVHLWEHGGTRGKFQRQDSSKHKHCPKPQAAPSLLLHQFLQPTRLLFYSKQNKTKGISSQRGPSKTSFLFGMLSTF